MSDLLNISAMTLREMRFKVVTRFKASKLRCNHYQNQCNRETHDDESVIGPLSIRINSMRKLTIN